MKRAWLYIVLGVSIGLNVGVVGSFVYRRQARLRRNREFTTHVDERVRHEVSDLMREYKVRMDSVRNEFRDARDSLLELGLLDDPDSAAVEHQLGRIAGTYREMSRMVYEAGRTIQKMHPVAKRKWLRRRMRKMMKDPHRQGRRGRGRGRRGRGSRHYHDESIPQMPLDDPTEPPPPPPGHGD